MLCRVIPEIRNPDWQPCGLLRYACDNTPVVLQRQMGDGKLLFFRSVLGPSLLHSSALRISMRRLFTEIAAFLPNLPRPANPTSGTIAIPCRLGAKQTLLILCSPTKTSRQDIGQVVLTGDAGDWSDAMTGEPLKPDRYGEIRPLLSDGIALIHKN